MFAFQTGVWGGWKLGQSKVISKGWFPLSKSLSPVNKNCTNLLPGRHTYLILTLKCVYQNHEMLNLIV